ncbi:unnamed protein product [Closterium sp. NIES-53]
MARMLKVGSLQFAVTTTRSDIAFACDKLGSDLTVRSDNHWREVDRCLHYLADTRDTTLEFSGGPEMMCLVGYVDADDASDKQNQMSTGGNVFVFEGAAVSWSSQRIKCATLSSTESEYVAATKASKEGRQLRFLLAEFQQLDAGTPMMVKRGKFVLRYIRTTEQPAAFMTKVLHFPAFNRCSVAIGQLRLADVGDGDDDVQQ